LDEEDEEQKDEDEEQQLQVHHDVDDFLEDLLYDDLECLREEHPELDDDQLQDLYDARVQEDAEEYGGYGCDSD